MTNITILKGNVGQDPELRTTQSGVKVATYSLAVYRPNPKDKTKALTDWFNVVAWGEQADLVMANIRKGTKIIASGKFQTRNYDDKDGKKVYVTEFMQDDFGIVPKKEEQAGVAPVTEDDSLPF